MENTNCGKDCPFVKQGFCNEEKECPNYCENWWINAKDNEPKLIKDCSPKRMLKIFMTLQTKVESVQSALEGCQNEYQKLNGYFITLMEASKKIIESNDINGINLPASHSTKLIENPD